MSIEGYLNPYYPKTYPELVRETGKCKRAVRQMLSDLRKDVPVIFNSQEPGFRLPKQIENINKEELMSEILNVRRSANEINSRARDLDMQLRTYIAWIYDAEKELETKQ